MAIIPTSGEFVKVPDGGGGGVTVVTFENSLASPDVYTANMTLDEMIAAQANGLIGIRLHHTARGDAYYQMTPMLSSPQFYSVIGTYDGIAVKYLNYNDVTDKWDYSEVAYPLTPSN